MSLSGTTLRPADPQSAGPPADSGHGRTPAWLHVVKWALIALVAAVAVYTVQQALEAGAWIFVWISAFILMSVVVVYSTRRFVPMKYMLPGLVLLLLFQIWPIAYTVATSFTNYGSGHTLTKEEAVDALIAQSVRQDPDAPRYGLAVAVPEGQDLETGELVFLLSRPAGEGAEGENVSGDVELFTGTLEGLEPLPADGVTLTDAGRIQQAEGFRVMNLLEQNARGAEVNEFAVPVEGGGIKAATANQAYVGTASLTYDAENDVMVDAEGRRYVPSEGNFVPEDGQGRPLATGWTENVGLDNFATIFTDPTLRGGFLKIFLWNLAFAVLSVGTTFVLGMLLALLFNDPRMKGKGIYRSLLILPYALPVFVTALVWAAMFNRQFGMINDVLGLDVNWLGAPWTARLALLIVNLWLGFPYMFLIATGALQSIPTDVREAAAVDGAGPVRTLVSVIMPLLLIAVGPLLIASFAFNFNNFGLIYLVTGGGPFDSGNSLVGNTDLLITFAYRLALEAGQPNIGLASAVSIVIFFVVGIISAIGFARSRVLEDVN